MYKEDLNVTFFADVWKPLNIIVYSKTENAKNIA